MTSPSGQQVSVALESLRSDATTWDHAADDLNNLKATIGGLHVTAADVSVWAADAGLDQTCNEVCTRLEGVIKQASDNFVDISGALRESANTYQREDEQGMHRLRGIY